ncbi:MAG: NUDIX domain-containing protein [bacterium]
MPTQVVTGVIVRDGKVLMCRRSRTKRYPLHWEFPGGKVEANESLLEALQRELREELVIEVRNAKVWFADEMTYVTETNSITYHVTFFHVSNFEGIPQNTEFEEIGWFGVDELRDLQHLSGNSNILRKIREEGLP